MSKQDYPGALETAFKLLEINLHDPEARRIIGLYNQSIIKTRPVCERCGCIRKGASAGLYSSYGHAETTLFTPEEKSAIDTLLPTGRQIFSDDMRTKCRDILKCGVCEALYEYGEYDDRGNGEPFETDEGVRILVISAPETAV